MKRKTLYLHIGTPKTGTTALQVFLRENRRALSRRGYAVYTAQDSCDDRNLRFLTAYLDVFGRLELRMSGKLMDDEQEASAFLARWFDAFVERLCRVKEQVLVLSEEMLWWAVCDGDKLKLVLDRLRAVFDVKVIVYLRRQDHYIMSVYQQAIKACNVNSMVCSDWIADPENRQVSQYTDYAGCLQKLDGFVGRENIRVRVYESRQLANSSIVDDFSNIIGIHSIEGLLVPHGNVNPGLNITGIELARCMNRIHSEPGFMKMIGRFELCHQLFNERGETYALLSNAERRAFLERYEIGNRWVAEEFFGRKELFNEPLPDGGNDDLPGQSGEDRVVPVLLLMINELSDRVERLEHMLRFVRKVRALFRFGRRG